MRKLKLFGSLAVTALLFAACSTPCPEAAPVEEIDMDAVRSEIGAMEAEYQRASNAHDIEGVLAYYADDATSFPPNKAARVGKDAMRAGMMANQDSTKMETLKLTTLDVWAAGNMAVETGLYADMAADGTVLDQGRYMSVFEKRDGKYVCIRDIWNSEMANDSMAEAAE